MKYYGSSSVFVELCIMSYEFAQWAIPLDKNAHWPCGRQIPSPAACWYMRASRHVFRD